MTPSTKRRLWTYTSYFLCWTAAAFFYFSQALTEKLIMRDPTPWWHFLVTWLVGMYLFAILAIGILWLGRRFPIERRNWVRHSALHLLVSICFAAIDLLIAAALYSRLGLIPTVFKNFSSAFGFLMVIDFHSNIIGYWIILGIQAGLRYYRAFHERQRAALRLELQASELKTQLANAQLSSLKMQLQPHFLFNTLNAITVLVRQRKTDLAEEMLGRLGDLLRCVLEDVEAQEVSLRRELEYVKMYLSIQQVRFGDRLTVNISADSQTLDAAVPQMALQPIIENAIRHGICALSDSGRIEIAARRDGGKLILTIEDDGPGFSTASEAREGIGLRNTEARLQQLYGLSASLRKGNRQEGGASVTFILPFHVAAECATGDMLEVHAS